MSPTFTLEELKPNSKANALNHAIELSLHSDEWKHVLFTSREIKRGLVALLENHSEDALISTVINTNALEKLEPFASFDMPASIRIAMEFVEEMACNDANVSYAINLIQSDLEEQINSYWETTFRSDYHVIEWITDAVDMTFNADGTIASLNTMIEEEFNYQSTLVADGQFVYLNLKTTYKLLPIAEALVTVFHYVKKEELININGLMKHLIDLKTNGQITTPKSETVKLKKSHVAIVVKDGETDYHLQDLLGYVADCLAFSDNVDSFTTEDLYQKLSNLDPQLAKFLKFAQDLYIFDNVCDVNSVKKEDLLIFSEYA